MNIIHRILLILPVIASLLMPQYSFPQQTPAEKVILVTDRTLYIKGETVEISASLISRDESYSVVPSQILYCELVTSQGNKITENKFLIEDGQASGSLMIPGDVTTGYYYLRAYTRFMRNYGPSAFCYRLLKIVNPDNPGVLNGNSPDTALTVSSPRIAPELSTDKSSYACRDTVKVIIGSLPAGMAALRHFSLSVVPENSVFPGQPQIVLNPAYKADKTYFRESRGLSITGSLTETKSGQPAQGARINLVIIGKGRDFMAVNTDEQGRFFFALPPYTGFRDLLLSTDSRNKDSLKLLIDNDFSTAHEKLPAPAFTLSENERRCALQMASNLKISSIYPGDTLPSEVPDKEYDNLFYGKPDETLVLDNYVLLSGLEEYFNELAIFAKIRKSRGKPYFKVFGEQPELNMYEPLVLVDDVAIDDPERILAISPVNVARIEIVNKIYIKGDQSYGGIISIISKQGDFAGIELPSSSLFINYRFLAGPEAIVNTNLPHHPDARNTLYWNPSFSLDNEHATTLSFTTADTPGKYTIILHGIGADGTIISKTADLVVLPRQPSDY